MPIWGWWLNSAACCPCTWPSQDEDAPVLVGFFMGGNKKYKLKEAIT